jgi:Tol biopolymer transport system component
VLRIARPKAKFTSKPISVYPRFSPDSRRIAYLHQDRGKNSVWVVNIDGSGRRRVLDEENDVSPDQVCWSPDGKSLAYTLEDWQRDKKGKQFRNTTETANPRLAIMDDEGKNRRPLDLPRARWLVPQLGNGVSGNREIV